jgi:dTDP-L-rhamnose 4-epimerase
MSPQHVLVTGGAGFIGSAIVDQLVAEGIEVTVLDNLDPAAHSTRPDYLNPSARYIWADVRDRDAWETALRAGDVSVDVVCHQAGKVGLGVDFGDVDAYVTGNDVGFAVGLRTLHERRFDGRIVLASSMVVYGEGRYLCAEHGVVSPAPRRAADLDAGLFEPPCPVCGSPLLPDEVPESATLDPRNVYAATKLHQEHLLWSFAREHPVAAATALRYHNVYGPRMPFNTPYAGVASIFRSALQRGVAPQVTEDGLQRRNFVHVHDVARANLAAMRGIDVNGAFNVASARSLTVGEMAQSLAGAFGASPGSELWPVVNGSYRLGDVRHVYASAHHAATTLGFVAAVDPADGLARFATDPLRQAVA